MQQGGEIIPVPQLPGLSSHQIKCMINLEQSLRSSSTPQMVRDKGFYYENMDIVRIQEQLQEPGSDVIDMTDEEGDQKEAEDVVDGDEDPGSRDEKGDTLYSSAIIQHKALYVLDQQSTAIAMQDFDPITKTLEDSKAVLITKVVKFYKKKPVDLFACSCDALRSRNVFNSPMDLFCCLKDFNNLYPLCLHIRALEKIKSVTSVIDLQQKSPDNCGFCSYENDKEVFCFTKLLFGKQLYTINSTDCTYGIVKVICGNFHCLICKGAECQHVKCLQNKVRSMDIDAAGVPEVLKEVYLNLFSVKPEDTKASSDSKETIYYHLSNGQTTVVGNSQSLEGLKLPPEKKRKKRVPQTDARRFHCDNCHKSFKHKHHLREHMHLHTGEQPFECKTCGRKFSHSGSLSQHRQRSCSSGTPCQTRQRNSNAKTGNSRKSSSPRLNTNVTDHKIDEDMKKSPQENEVSPPVTKSKKAVSPRSNLSDQKRSMEYIDIKTESFSSPVKSVGRFVAGETHTVSPDSVMYKSGLKSHDIPVTLKQPDMSSDGVNYMTLDSSVTESLDVKPLVKTEGNSFIQHPSDFLSKICPEQSSVVKTEKVIIKQEEHVCLVCKKTFSGAQCLHVHMRMHTRSEMPFWCEVCSQGFPQNIQLQCHLGSEEHQRKQAQKLQESSALGTAISTVVSAEPPLPTVTSVQSENAEPTELSFSKPVLSQMINTPSWDMFTSKSTTSLPSISELMSSVTTHSSRKKETMSLAQQSVISDRILMSGNSDSSYSSGLQLMSSAPDEVIQQCTPKIHLYDPNAPSLSNDKLPMMQQMELSQNQAKLKLVSSENLTNASPTSSTSPVSSNIQQSSTIIQSQHSYLPQPSFSQHSPGQAAAPSSYGTYPAMNQVTTTEQDSALKALCSFTEKPIPSDAAESLAGVTGNDNSILTEQKNPSPEASGETSVVYNYAQSWNGWNNWNGAYPMYGAPGQTQNWNGSFVVPMASSWQGYPETNTNGGVPTSASSGSQMNSGIPTNTEQKSKVIPQPKPPAKPKAPYSRYSIKVWNSVKSSNPNLSVGEMNRLIGQMWRGLPEDEKNQFLEDYSVEKEKYKVEYEKFRSSPEFQIWLASNIDKNSNSKKRPYDAEAEQLEDRQDYRQFIVKAT